MYLHNENLGSMKKKDPELREEMISFFRDKGEQERITADEVLNYIFYARKKVGTIAKIGRVGDKVFNAVTGLFKKEDEEPIDIKRDMLKSSFGKKFYISIFKVLWGC